MLHDDPCQWLQMSIQACYYILGGPEYLYGLVVAAYDIMQVLRQCGLRAIQHAASKTTHRVGLARLTNPDSSIHPHALRTTTSDATSFCPTILHR